MRLAPLWLLCFVAPSTQFVVPRPPTSTRALAVSAEKEIDRKAAVGGGLLGGYLLLELGYGYLNSTKA